MNDRVKGLVTVLALLLVMALMGFLVYYGVTFTDKNGIQTSYFSYRNIKQGLDLKGGVYIVFEAKNPTGDDMKRAESIIRERLDSKGSTEATVSLQGSNRLRVEIPDVEDADAAVEDIGKTAQLMFVTEDGEIIATGADVTEAKYQEYPDVENGVQVSKPGVAVTFNSDGAQRFSDATANNIGRSILIILDDAVISSPVVKQHITGNSCSISGSFTVESANYLATLIKAGALPVPLEAIEMNRIGAQLGSDALAGSIKAGVMGTALVLLFMLIVYRFSGFSADLALLFFMLAEFLVLSIFRITLTLPGIAGIILTIGMAVDANVVIFERMKEELAQGKTIRTAIEAGFSRAMPAILDGNITTLIAAFVLFFLGTGPIKGFAQTLILGVIISMVSAIFVTRAFISGFYKLGISNRALYAAKAADNKADREIKVVENRKKYYIFSCCIIAVMVGFAAVNASTGKGIFNLDVDFSGGTSLNYELGQDAEVGDIERIVSEASGVSSPRVQKIVGTTEVAVKLQKVTPEERAAITDALRQSYQNAELISYSDVSSTVSGEMQSKALTAVLLSCVAMLIYITARFKDVKMGASAIAALTHDMLVMLAVYVVFRIPVNNSFIAAILTILGYSINATIIVFDRIRENKKFIKRHETERLINRSITQTLSRSVNTSLTTLLTITCVYIFGVTSVREFALPLIVGIICGAYSSVFFAGSVWYTLLAGKLSGNTAKS